MEYWTIPLAIVIGTLGIYYLFRNFNFFKRHGVIHLPPLPIFGNMASIIFRRKAFPDLVMTLNTKFPGAKYFGFYATTNPVILLRDPEIIKSILTKNFETFPDRRGFEDFNDTLFSKNLFSLKGQKWRDVRSLLSPSFTSSKMKIMFTLMSECAVEFAEFLSTLPEDKGDMDVKDAFAKYTNDVIATCAFGIKINSMKDPTNTFFVYGKDATNFSGFRTLKFLFLRTFPRLANILHVRMITKHVSDFFTGIIKSTIDMRDSENITRPDMLQLMMDIRGKEGRRELDIDDMTAQAFIFFFGGFDTTSTAMSFVAHEIAANSDVQKKLQEEIDQVVKESNGEVTYETINRLEYLNAVINEGLRLYPPVVFLERLCAKTYELPPTLPGEKPFIMKKGMTIWIPVFALHRDEKYYDEPEKFRPERFLNNAYHNSLYYLPFGSGPRMCIANRFALLEVKVLLFHLLARCELKPCAKTTIPVKFSKTGLAISPEGGFCIYYLFRNFNFFKRHGVIHLPLLLIFGNMASIIFRRKAFPDLIMTLNTKFPGAKYFGFYDMATPVFLLRDPEIIKSILTKNFETFPDRRGFEDFNDTLFSKNLFSLKGQKWRDVRSLLSPSFTSSKMKIMFTLMSECAVEFAEFLSTLPEDKGDMDVKDAFAKYTNDVIATCAFGIKINSMKDPTNTFFVYGKDATNFSGFRTLKFLFLRTFPRLANILHVRMITKHVSDFFTGIIKSTIDMRDSENITRPDMLQLMMDIRGKEGRRELDIDDMTAQAFIFFFGGFDTTSTAMSFVAHEIAANSDVQKKLQEEIDQVVKESNGEVTYETINRLEYLNAVINEGLRLYPPVVFLERLCAKTYELPPTLPGEKPFIMKKGMTIWIPVFALHRDEKYYDEPEKFRPERFLNNAYHNSLYYLPFGSGPRMCIANRFALLEVKVLLFHLLARCELKPCAKTTIPVKFSKTGLAISPEGGFWLNVRRRSDTQFTFKSTMGNDIVSN
ncbi:uncharacterized protein LOC105277280 [Ooceraea biroi]|uniref:uncharacterized protein LOC105277280 n=1 Tax=Ooceraea biroi TaxID=2015173 RepID=UPI000F087D38|nr:uncharacterized protein LOC105277280 [Ooceraea biroi]